MAIVPVIAISVGNGATQKESNDPNLNYVNSGSILSGADDWGSYYSSVMDEEYQYRLESALLLLHYAQSLERISNLSWEQTTGRPVAPRSLSASTTGEVAAVVCQPIFTWDCQWAVNTVWCESKNDPNVSNPAGPYNGWWQVTNGPFDPYLNTVEGHIQYHQWIKGERPDPWPNC